MTSVEPGEQGKTTPIQRPALAPTSSDSPGATPLPDPADVGETEPPLVEGHFTANTLGPAVQPASAVVRAGAPHSQDVVFVPLAVNVGDGFKFGCGFFLALVVAMLIGFVLLAALFLLTTIFGLNLPLTR